MTNQKGRNMMPKEKDFIEKTLEEMNEWKSLSASETGRLGGVMNRKIRQRNQKEK